LKHVCAPKATKRTPTNIMTSAECKLGSGGLRNLGFTPVQLQTILSTYNQYP
ncbi:metalloprotease, partial [Pseudomonas aeruginosa]